MLNSKSNKVLLLLVLLLIILPFFVLCGFVHPSSDDYNFGYFIKENGFWGYLSHYYNKWGGRYYGNTIIFLNPLNYDSFVWYKIIPFINLTLLYLSILFAVNTFSGKEYSKTTKNIISLSVLILFLNIMPSTSESIYWTTGLLVNTLPIVFLITALSLLYKSYIVNNKLLSLFSYIISCILFIMVAGANETIAVFLFEIFAVIVFVNGFARTNRRSYIIYVIVIVCWAIVIMSPGNYQRMRHFPNAFNLYDSITIASMSLIKLLGIFIQSPVFLLCTLLIVVNADKINENNIILNKISKYKLIYIYLIFFATLYSIYYPSALAMGINPPLRIHNTIAFVFIILWFMLIAITLIKIKTKYKFTSFVVHPIVNKIIIVIAIVLLLTDFYKQPGGNICFRGNVTRAYYDLLFVANKYDKEMQQRYSTIIKHKNTHPNDTLTVAPIKNKPQTILFIDIKTDVNYDYNNGVSQYFKIKAIRIPELNKLK